ncbi:MAG: hypothetical protein OXN90_06660, partial [Gemmatimonadota bacterium]|nr:hypothetical protein [Gemmatimonadota bacterium]
QRLCTHIQKRAAPRFPEATQFIFRSAATMRCFSSGLSAIGRFASFFLASCVTGTVDTEDDNVNPMRSATNTSATSMRSP